MRRTTAPEALTGNVEGNMSGVADAGTGDDNGHADADIGLKVAGVVGG